MQDKVINPSKITIVGAGTAGLVSALILKTRFPSYDIKIICSKKIGTIGVGEGSTEHWHEFTSFVGINLADLIKATDATFKIGVVFKGWGVPDYMHSIQDGYNETAGEYPYVFGSLIGNGAMSQDLSGEVFWKNKLHSRYLKENNSPVTQYHFNTFKLIDFLTGIASERGIEIIDDEIKDVVLNEQGEIAHLSSEHSTYTSDFFIDSTGFKKLLISKLGAKWKSHSEYLKTNSAIVFQTQDSENYNMWSMAQGMKYGWMFRTPTFGRWGNGYIYDSEFLTPEQAQQEVEEFLGIPIKIGQHLKFDPGAVDRAWIKNCCAIGLSSSFIEPLEASSIGTTIQQTFMLMHKLVNYNDAVVDNYNRSFRDIIENIRDFVLLHFITPRRDTEFWRKVADVELPNSLTNMLKSWEHKLPVQEDFSHLSRYILFKQFHFILVLHGLKLFNVESIQKEFESLPLEVKNHAKYLISDIRNYYKDSESADIITHKQALEFIRES